ncbi:MAG: hypothetical protein NT091_01130 [Candidatus Falkowbacteria bacterium]|nr:hypothetical protein [Candidatus Falkowbacteria bacterium]
MYEIYFSKQFKKDLKKISKNSIFQLEKLENILLIYKKDKENLRIDLVRIGSHSELF